MTEKKVSSLGENKRIQMGFIVPVILEEIYKINSGKIPSFKKMFC
jgi:hypothetical protein